MAQTLVCVFHLIYFTRMHYAATYVEAKKLPLVCWRLLYIPQEFAKN